MPAVSVIIPTFNHESFVLETLSSVFAQTFSDYEVILVNDGSPDDTARILAPLAAAGRITYIEQPNSGQARARNRGLAVARGDYVALLDDDDLWPPDKLAWQVGALESQRDATVVAGGIVCIGTGGERLKTQHRQPVGVFSFDALFRGCPIISPGQTLIRASALREAGGMDARFWGADDYDLWFRMARLGRIIGTARPSLFYRIHGANASADTSRLLLNALLVVREHLKRAPAQLRGARRREANKFLYEWAGRRTLCRTLINLASGNLRPAARSFPAIARLFEQAFTDPDLFRWLFGDLLRPWLWRAGCLCGLPSDA